MNTRLNPVQLWCKDVNFYLRMINKRTFSLDDLPYGLKSKGMLTKAKNKGLVKQTRSKQYRLNLRGKI